MTRDADLLADDVTYNAKVRRRMQLVLAVLDKKIEMAACLN